VIAAGMLVKQATLFGTFLHCKGEKLGKGVRYAVCGGDYVPLGHPI